MARKYSPSASKDVEREMHKLKRGNLKSGKGGKADQERVASKPLQSGFQRRAKRARRSRRKRPARVCPALASGQRDLGWTTTLRIVFGP